MSDQEPTHRLVGGSTHRFTDDDGNPVIWEPGDEVRPSERDLEAFPDRFEPLGGADDGDEAVVRDDHTVLHGRIDEGTREDLWDAGFETFDDIRNATIEELADVQGIGVVTAEEILEQVGVEVESEQSEEDEESEETDEAEEE